MSPRGKDETLTELEADLLTALGNRARHGYALSQELQRWRSGIGNALKGMETRGLVTSTVKADTLPARRVYRMTKAGRTALKEKQG